MLNHLSVEKMIVGKHLSQRMGGGKRRVSAPLPKPHLPGVGGTQVDADHRAHVLLLVLLLRPCRAEQQQQHRGHQGQLHLSGTVGQSVSRQL